jgi:hypothetical protein
VAGADLLAVEGEHFGNEIPFLVAVIDNHFSGKLLIHPPIVAVARPSGHRNTHWSTALYE